MKAGSSPEGPGRVLVVDDHARARQSMVDVLHHAGHQVHCASSASEALGLVERLRPDVIITDLCMPGMSGLDLIRRLEEQRCDAQIVMISAHGSVSTAVEAMRHGAFDFIEKPFDADQLEQLVARALRHGTLLGRRSSMPAAEQNGYGAEAVAMIGDSPVMRQLRQRVYQVAVTNETVLITGESGTGKELVARLIHASSRRADGPLVSLNCPALSPQLMESELFGHQRGAFTSADAPRVGRFELADQGTILLDEITEIELPLQAKLLRVLQEKTFERVGASESLKVDVRVLATTNRQLEEEVRGGRFRQDLYFRLAVVPIRVPPLRERLEDVPALADYFFRQVAERLNKSACELDDRALDLLTSYHWPGNVRELQNLITRASVLSTEQRIHAEDLRPWLIDADRHSGTSEMPADSSALIPVGTSLQEMERALIEATMEHYGGHRARTAQALGIGVRTLANKLRAYGYAPRTKVFAREA